MKKTIMIMLFAFSAALFVSPSYSAPPDKHQTEIKESKNTFVATAFDVQENIVTEITPTFENIALLPVSTNFKSERKQSHNRKYNRFMKNKYGVNKSDKLYTEKNTPLPDKEDIQTIPIQQLITEWVEVAK